MESNTTHRDLALPTALAALSIIESVMIVLCERGLVSRGDMLDAMQVAVDSHLNAEPRQLDVEDHHQAAEVIQVVMRGSNAIRATAHL